MAEQYYEGIGRRKASTARVRVMSGSGEFLINEKPLEEYFPRLRDVQTILGPVETVTQRGSLDVSVLVRGGGVTGQAGAVQLGLARALMVMDPENKPDLRKGGFLTRDAREKERKKPLRIIKIMGWMTVLRYLLGRLPLNQALEQMSRRMGLRAGVIQMPFAEAAIDVDKADDLLLVESILAEREKRSRL